MLSLLANQGLSKSGLVRIATRIPANPRRFKSRNQRTNFTLRLGQGLENQPEERTLFCLSISRLAFKCRLTPLLSRLILQRLPTLHHLFAAGSMLGDRAWRLDSLPALGPADSFRP